MKCLISQGTGSVAHTREAVPGKKGAEAPRTWEPSSQHQCHQQNLAPLSRATARLCVPSGGLRTSVSICAIQEPKDRPAPPTVTSVLRCHLSLMPLLVPICSLGGPEHWPTPSNTTCTQSQGLNRPAPPTTTSAYQSALPKGLETGLFILPQLLPTAVIAT